MSFFIFMMESQFLRRKKLWRIAYGTVTYEKYPVAREKLKREEKWTYFIKSCSYWDFPVNPLVKSPCSQWKGYGFDPWSEKILHALWYSTPPHTQIRASCSY